MKTLTSRLCTALFTLCLFPAFPAAGESPAFSWPDLETLEPIEDIRALPDDILTRKAICYSGYREGQSPRTEVYPSDAEVLEDLKLLVAEGFGWIRVYNSPGHGEQVIRVIDRHDIDLKVQLGAYISGRFADNPKTNIAEITRAVEPANAHPDIVMGVSVGNETLVSWSFVAVPPREVAGYLQYVRTRIEQPVTVNDNWEPYAAGPGEPVAKVWTQIDYASIHTYPYWDAGFRKWPFRQETDAAMMAAACTYARENFQAVRKALDAGGIDVPIVIGETGWQNLPSAREASALEPDFAQVLAGPQKQKIYYHSMQDWTYGEDGDHRGDGFTRPAALFYFAAFDEPWKKADDNWGLWDAERERKPVLE